MVGILLYRLLIILYGWGIYFYSFYDEKASKWIDGRKNWKENLQTALGVREGFVWIHCASLGEFEQGRPVLEAIREQYPERKILLTFFSPSGYEIQKNYKGADLVCYLPLDTPSNAGIFFDLVKPELILFIKYEFWNFFINEAKKRDIPLILISGIFRKNQPFFKWYGGFFKKMLHSFTHLFVQDQQSKELLSKIISKEKISIGGDTRFDRVRKVLQSNIYFPEVADFIQNKLCFVAGSTWPEDEKLLITPVLHLSKEIKWIIVPHEISARHIEWLKGIYPGAVLYSELEKQALADGQNVLIVDKIGMLSRLYQYASVTFIGGGFGKGIHNTLEAAVYGKPIIHGPNYHKFKEAVELSECGASKVVFNGIELSGYLNEIFRDQEMRILMGHKAAAYVKENAGATDKVMFYIRENLLLN